MKIVQIHSHRVDYDELLGSPFQSNLELFSFRIELVELSSQMYATHILMVFERYLSDTVTMLNVDIIFNSFHFILF